MKMQSTMLRNSVTVNLNKEKKEKKQTNTKKKKDNKLVYFSSFDDMTMIDGNATIALEIQQDLESDLDYCFIPVGGGGLAAGISLVLS